MTKYYALSQHLKLLEVDFCSDLNPQQLAAVQARSGAHLVIAGAGSGKTRTLTYRVAWLLKQGVSPKNILLLTFTNKAAREMLERVATLVPEGSAGIWGGTFHSISNRILRFHAEEIGFRPGFSILDREDQQDLIESIVVREGLRTGGQHFPKSAVLSEIFGLAINTMTSIQSVLECRYPYFLEIDVPIGRIARTFALAKREANSLDFDDLVSKALELMKTSKDIATFYQEKFQYILVDEYQDTNRLQSEFVEQLAVRHGNIMAVGDDAQSIYSWRGASFQNILDFPRRHSNASIFRIETNYRSTPEILAVTNAVIRANQHQFEKTLIAARRSKGKKPAWIPLGTNTEQAAFVAQRILEIHEEGIALNEIAVLYRAHYHSMEVQLELTRRGIPFVVTSGLRFFEQAHIKDIAAFMKFASNPRDEIAFKRMVRLLPGIGAKTADSIWIRVQACQGGARDFSNLANSDFKTPTKSRQNWIQLTHILQDLVPSGIPLPPASMIEVVLFAMYDDYMKENFTNYDARREDIHTLAVYAENFEVTEEFLSQLALLGSVENADDLAVRSDGMTPVGATLSSIHQAKGLEWKAVFLIWLAEGMFPGSRSLENPEALEEERRLFYVGLTRCKDELYLSYPQLRLGGGYGDVFQRPSRFVEEIPKEALEYWKIGYSSSEEEPF